LVAIVGAEYDGAAHLAADAILAGSLQDHRFTDRKHVSRKVASHPEAGPSGVGAEGHSIALALFAARIKPRKIGCIESQ